MSINTKRVAGRRELWFDSFDEVLSDAERCVTQGYRPLGNWSTGQILSHLSRTIVGSVDGFGFRSPWFIRWFAPLLKQRFLKQRMPAGFKLPRAAAAELVPTDETAAAAGLELLGSAIAHVQSTSQRAPSPIFGPMSAAESDRLQFNHAAMHLSFLVPACDSQLTARTTA